MKILISTDCYIFQTGGVANVVLALEHSLRDMGYEVRVLALSDNGQSRKVGESCIFCFPYRCPEHLYLQFSCNASP